MTFNILTSIYGRRFGITTTGGLASGHGATGGQSSAVGSVCQMWGDDLTFVTTSTGGATLRNSGINGIASSVANPLFTVPAPVKGLTCEIYVMTSSSLITLNSTATAIQFLKAGVAASSALVMTDVSLLGANIVLRGLSTTQWGVQGSTAIVS